VAASSVTVSAVVPTRNRPESLARTLRALAYQERRPEEVIVADASDVPLDPVALTEEHPSLVIRHFHMAPGLCAQRNRAIAAAQGTHVFLCDDDVEPGASYLRRLVEYLAMHPAEGAVTGFVCDPEAVADHAGGYGPPSFRAFLYRFVFQLGMGCDMSGLRAPPGLLWFTDSVRRWYARRGNTWTLAGWPIVTRVERPVVHSTLSVLGASLVRRDWLLASPYAERLDALDPHAIGDNYGVCLGFGRKEAVAILTDLPVAHHRVEENRLDRGTAQLHRVLALHYFMTVGREFGRANRAWLVWSLAGQGFHYLRHRQGTLLRASAKAAALIALGRNPLVRAIRRPSPPGATASEVMR
jgi:glycosyltransferase involved in cell wall biosynthesis